MGSAKRGPAGWVSLLAFLGGGCLEELPEPLTCPPEAVVRGGNCVSSLVDPPVGCFGPADVTCLAGNVDTCKCTSEACPTPEAACFPEDDCPEIVRDVAGNRAHCRPLEKASFGVKSFNDQAVCVCGCSDCAAVCDGRGPIAGVSTIVDPGPIAPAGLIVHVTEEMPSQGRLGIYARIRGYSAYTLLVGTGSETMPTWHVYYIDLVQSDGEFTDKVHFDEAFGDTGAYRWERAEDKPTLVAVLLTGTEPGPTGGTAVTGLFEIDCVVPFTLPSQ